MQVLGINNRFVCDNCQKLYWSYNTWLLCDNDEDHTVLATFCCEECRTEYVSEKDDK